MSDFRRDFLRFALQEKVLSFGEFQTKAGRLSPYFFNAGLFNHGAALWQLAQFYARSIIDSKIEFDMLFGPAYKGIVLAATTATALSQWGKDVPFAYNRKEAKDHGEGGVIVGAKLAGRVLIIDDVISAGTSVRESVELIKNANAQVAGVAIALDRMEKGIGELSAVEEVKQQFNIPVVPIATLNDLLAMLAHDKNPELTAYLPKVEAYRQAYGV
ncbi:MAG: orotate phosphoribosyltransferase [Neisseriaceae bacterium]|nr:orotate phosphoribosyltransferase [Neisseriaceae bacterium]MBQ9259968.1 orotate phosphoribosyltransferase [Neisseriaceae bacterium]MBR1819357.1 orotate phosphoribosyltransferase [Neisseriaceae bacterium]